MGLINAMTGAYAAKQQERSAKTAAAQARSDRERAVWMADQQDWTPEYATDHVGTYQRSTSPAADAFLSSLLSGDNPSAVQGTRNQAPQMKARAQQRFDRSTGGWDALRARQAEMQASTPWEVKPFERQISKPDLSSEAWTAQRAGGMSPEEAKQLEQDGFKFNELGQFRTKASGKAAQSAMRVGDPNSPQARQYMRGLARTRADGLSLDEALARGPDYLMARGGE